MAKIVTSLLSLSHTCIWYNSKSFGLVLPPHWLHQTCYPNLLYTYCETPEAWSCQQTDVVEHHSYQTLFSECPREQQLSSEECCRGTEMEGHQVKCLLPGPVLGESRPACLWSTWRQTHLLRTTALAILPPAALVSQGSADLQHRDQSSVFKDARKSMW